MTTIVVPISVRNFGKSVATFDRPVKRPSTQTLFVRLVVGRFTVNNNLAAFRVFLGVFKTRVTFVYATKKTDRFYGIFVKY